MKKRPLLDLVLVVLLLVELASFFVSGRVHEVLGCVFVVLVGVHLVWNAGFFRAVGRGRYGVKRVAGTVVVLAFAVDMLVLTVSGVATSHFLFPWVKIGHGLNWRSLHLGAAAAAAFLLCFHGALVGGRYVRGKRIFPIITHGGTGAGEAPAVLQDAAKGATIATPEDVYSSDVPGARGRIAAYLKEGN